MAFKAPLNYLSIYDETIQKIETLIDLKYLDLEKGIFRKWLSNFFTPEEKYFSTLLLNRLIYRNKKATIAMCQNLIQIKMPKILNELNVYNSVSISEFENVIKNKSKIKDLKFCISTIENVDKNIGKSGSYLIRELKIEQIIFKDITFNVTSQSKKPEHVNTIIFIDDFIGTGTQFDKFYKKYKNEIEQFKYIIYMPLVAFVEGINFIKNSYPHVSILPLEKLDKNNTFFYSKNIKFDNVNTVKELQDFYKQLIKAKKINLNSSQYNLYTLYLFKLSAPNNNLPIIYCEDELNWNKLFVRF